MTYQDMHIDGIRLHYLTAGRGESLLFLHGTALDSSELTYGSSIPLFAEHYQVIAFDWPGYGKSDKPDIEYTTEFYSGILEKFIVQLDLDNITVAAFSMGGAITLGYMLKKPGRIKKIILIDSYGLGNEIHVPLIPYLGLAIRGADDVIWNGMKDSPAFLNWCLKFLVFGSSNKVTKEVISDVKEQLGIDGLKRAFASWLRSEIGWRNLRTDFRPRLSEVTVPTLLIHGEKDFVIPARRSKRAVSLFPNAELSIVKGCGHWLPREANDEFNQRVLEFLTVEN